MSEGAFSPSFAREGLRRTVRMARTGGMHCANVEDYVHRILDAPDSIYESVESYVAWCHRWIGPAPAPWLGEGRIIG